MDSCLTFSGPITIILGLKAISLVYRLPRCISHTLNLGAWFGGKSKTFQLGSSTYAC